VGTNEIHVCSNVGKLTKNSISKAEIDSCGDIGLVETTAKLGRALCGLHGVEELAQGAVGTKNISNAGDAAGHDIARRDTEADNSDLNFNCQRRHRQFFLTEIF